MIPLFEEHLPDDVVKLLNLFRRIVLYMSNSSFTKSELKVLKDHEDSFLKCFMNVCTNYAVTQKVHRILHYHQSIAYLGNTVNFSCFPYEGFLSFLSHGTHSTKSNLNELYFLSNLNTNIDTYVSKYVHKEDPLFYKTFKNVITIDGVRYNLKNKQGESKSGRIQQYQVLHNIDEDIKYDVRENQGRMNNHICYTETNGGLQYGKIQSILYNGNVILMKVKQYDVYNYEDMKIDDLFQFDDHFKIVSVRPSAIKCKYVIYPFREKEYFIVSTYNKQIY
jgi:hypothetical protein